MDETPYGLSAAERAFFEHAHAVRAAACGEAARWRSGRAHSAARAVALALDHLVEAADEAWRQDRATFALVALAGYENSDARGWRHVDAMFRGHAAAQRRAAFGAALHALVEERRRVYAPPL